MSTKFATLASASSPSMTRGGGGALPPPPSFSSSSSLSSLLNQHRHVSGGGVGINVATMAAANIARGGAPSVNLTRGASSSANLPRGAPSLDQVGINVAANDDASFTVTATDHSSFHKYEGTFDQKALKKMGVFSLVDSARRKLEAALSRSRSMSLSLTLTPLFVRQHSVMEGHADLEDHTSFLRRMSTASPSTVHENASLLLKLVFDTGFEEEVFWFELRMVNENPNQVLRELLQRKNDEVRNLQSTVQQLRGNSGPAQSFAVGVGSSVPHRIGTDAAVGVGGGHAGPSRQSTNASSPDLSPTISAMGVGGGLGSAGMLGVSVGLGGHSSAGLLGIGGGGGGPSGGGLRDSMRDLSISQPATVSRGTSRRSLGGLGSAGVVTPPVGSSTFGGHPVGGLFDNGIGLFPANFAPTRSSPSPPNSSQHHNSAQGLASASRGHARSHPHVHSQQQGGMRSQGHPTRGNPTPISRPARSISPGLRPVHATSQQHTVGTSVSNAVSQLPNVEHSQFPPLSSNRRVSPVLNPFGVNVGLPSSASVGVHGVGAPLSLGPGVGAPGVGVGGGASVNKIVGGPTKTGGGGGGMRVTSNGADASAAVATTNGTRRYRGRCKWFDPAREFGFLECYSDKITQDVWIHQSNIVEKVPTTGDGEPTASTGDSALPSNDMDSANTNGAPPSSGSNGGNASGSGGTMSSANRHLGPILVENQECVFEIEVRPPAHSGQPLRYSARACVPGERPVTQAMTKPKRYSGICVFFNPAKDKDFGFIKTPELSEREVFVHREQVRDNARLVQGQQCEFELIEHGAGKLKAVNVVPGAMPPNDTVKNRIFSGVVVRWFSDKRFGFIRADNDSKEQEVMVHARNLKSGSSGNLVEGQHVRFKIVKRWPIGSLQNARNQQKVSLDAIEVEPGLVPEKKVLTGFVKFFDRQKEFGFIFHKGTKQEYFVHSQQIISNEVNPLLEENEVVTFIQGIGKNGKPRALDVRRVAEHGGSVAAAAAAASAAAGLAPLKGAAGVGTAAAAALKDGLGGGSGSGVASMSQSVKLLPPKDSAEGEHLVSSVSAAALATNKDGRPLPPMSATAANAASSRPNGSGGSGSESTQQQHQQQQSQHAATGFSHRNKRQRRKRTNQHR